MKRCPHCGQTLIGRTWRSMARGFWRWRETRRDRGPGPRWTPWGLLAAIAIVGGLAYPLAPVVTAACAVAFILVTAALANGGSEERRWWQR